MNQRIHFWGAPVMLHIPRWLLTLMYAVTALIGVIIYLLYVPSLHGHMPGVLSSIWGLMLAVSSVISAIASLGARGETVERWTCMLVSSLLFAFALVPFRLILHGNLSVAVYSAIAFYLSLVPSARCVSLIVKTGRRHEHE